MTTRGQPTILFVDDDLEFRSVFAEVLAMSGFKVLVAPGAEQALHALTRHPVDLLISEIVLPGTSGLALAEQAQSIKPVLRALYTTGSPEHAAEYERARHGRVLRKPFQPAEIVAEIRRALEGWPWAPPEEDSEPPLPAVDEGLQAAPQSLSQTPPQEP
jgi:DNA-binding NtrC family response regulator